MLPSNAYRKLYEKDKPSTTCSGSSLQHLWAADALGVAAGFACMESPRKPVYQTSACPLQDAEEDTKADEIASNDKRKVTKSYLTLPASQMTSSHLNELFPI